MQWHQWRILKPGTVHHFPGHEESTGHNWTHTGLTSKTKGKAPHNCLSVANSPLLTKKLRNLKWLYIPRSHMPWFGITNTFSMCWLQILVTKVVSAISVRIAQTLNHLNCYSVPRYTKLFPNQPRYSGHLNFSPFLHLQPGLQFYPDIQTMFCSTDILHSVEENKKGKDLLVPSDSISSSSVSLHTQIFR